MKRTNSNEQSAESNPYMGAPVSLGKAPNGAIANKKLLDGIEKVGWVKPEIEKPTDGVWVLGGYQLAPISVIDTDEGLIAFDTGDTKHDGETLLKAIRTFSQKPVKAIIYGHSHTVLGAGVLAEGNTDVMVIGHPGLNAVVEKNVKSGGLPAYFPEIGPFRRAVAEFVGEPNKYYRKPDVTIAMSGEAWAKLYLSQVTPEDLIKSGDLKVTGDPAEAARLINLFDRYSPEKAVVVPPAAWDHI